MKQVISLFAIAAALFVQGCEEPVTPPAPLELSEVILDREEAVIKRGETLVLSYTVEPEGVSCGQAVWISSDPSVATVDQSGKVVAVSTGTAEITVTVDTKSDICLITVDPVMPESIRNCLNLFIINCKSVG